MSERIMHLLPAGELFRQGYPNTPVAACGEPVISGPQGEDEEPPRYCRDCVRAAVQGSDWPGRGAS